MLHLALKAFYPAQAAVPAAARRYDLEVPRHDRVPRPTWRDELGLELLVHTNQEGVRARHQSVHHRLRRCTPTIMKTEALKQALDQYGFDAAFGGARRDEEKSRAKERIFSFRTAQPRLGPEATSGPSCGASTTPGSRKGETIRVFPLSNWTELDIWQYILARGHPDRAALLRRSRGRWSSATAR